MKVTNVVLLAVINSNLKSAEAIRRAALQLQKAVEDDEEELPDSSTTAAALATESNVEHIKHMEEKLDTGVLDGAADESDRILRKKNKKGKGGKKSKNMFVKDDGCSCPSSDTTDTAMELEEAKAKIAELEKKLGQCDANGEDVRYYGSRQMMITMSTSFRKMMLIMQMAKVAVVEVLPHLPVPPISQMALLILVGVHVVKIRIVLMLELVSMFWSARFYFPCLSLSILILFNLFAIGFCGVFEQLTGFSDTKSFCAKQRSFTSKEPLGNDFLNVVDCSKPCTRFQRQCDYSKNEFCRDVSVPECTTSTAPVHGRCVLG